MTKVELEMIKQYLDHSKSFSNYFGLFCRLYSMTTENIYDFLKKYDLNGKKILTVAGSGDQRLNAYLLGAKDVTCFDINPLTEMHMMLKDQCIKRFSLDDFLYFFGYGYGKEFDKNFLLSSRLFNEIKNELDDYTYEFFDYIINGSINYSPKDIYFEGENLDVLEKLNGYLSFDNYERLRSILKGKKVDFIDSNVDTLPDRLCGEKFDMILLSNISDYTHHIYDKDDLENYRILIDRLMDNLNLYGIMQVGYIYSYYSRGEDVSNFHVNKNRQEYFPTSIFHSCFVPSYYNDGSYDKVITYQKLK